MVYCSQLDNSEAMFDLTLYTSVGRTLRLCGSFLRAADTSEGPCYIFAHKVLFEVGGNFHKHFVVGHCLWRRG